MGRARAEVRRRFRKRRARVGSLENMMAGWMMVDGRDL